jgi:hypothetical protein
MYGSTVLSSVNYSTGTWYIHTLVSASASIYLSIYLSAQHRMHIASNAQAIYRYGKALMITDLAFSVDELNKSNRPVVFKRKKKKEKKKTPL